MNKKEQNEDLFDALLKVAVNEALQRELITLPSNEELNIRYKPSPELDRHITKIINQYKMKTIISRNARRILKITACIIVILILSSFTLMSVEATRNIIFNAFIERFETFTKIDFEASKVEDENNQYYSPTYLPEGFHKDTTNVYGNTIMITYINDDGVQIIFQQREADAGTALIDNENTIYKEVEVAGQKAYLFEPTTKNEYRILLWQKNRIVFELTAQISSEDLLHIGNSIKFLE